MPCLPDANTGTCSLSLAAWFLPRSDRTCHWGPTGVAPVSSVDAERWKAGADAVSPSHCRFHESGLCRGALTFDGAVDRRAADAEEFTDLEDAVLATVDQ
jgi:hypothetical protein